MTLAEKTILKIINNQPKDEDFLFKKIRQISNQEKIRPISKVELLEAYHSLIKQQKIKQNKFLEKVLQKRQIRTLSGVAVVSLLTKPYPCPGKCFYCPQEKGMPKSYLSNEPAVMRAVLCKFNPYKQIQARLESLEKTGHPTDKLEIIVIGGTWSYLPTKYQRWFIKKCFQVCNEYTPIVPPKGHTPLKSPQGDISKSPFNKGGQPRLDESRRGRGILSSNHKTLKELQKTNEKAKHRIIGLTLETRPDYINLEEIKKMREYGCTRVELGVQCLDDKILKFNQREHGIKEVINATKLLKDAGFKICYHLMPNLPGSNLQKDLQTFKDLFTKPEFQPDMLKIYPTVVVKGSPLYNYWKKGEYKPYTNKQLLNLLIKIKQIVPPYVRINRLIRDIPSTSIFAGNKISNLREVVQRKMTEQNLKCRCIRCREIKDLKFKIANLKLKIIKYPASEGMEYFLSYEDVKNDKLIAFLRLRLPQFQNPKSKILNPKQIINSKFKIQNLILPYLKDCALIRELHTYGHLVPIGQKNKKTPQHAGWGKKLMLEAEKIALKSGYQKIAVISGVGVREYYKKLGYKLEENYMIKNRE